MRGLLHKWGGFFGIQRLQRFVLLGTVSNQSALDAPGTVPFKDFSYGRRRPVYSVLFPIF